MILLILKYIEKKSVLYIGFLYILFNLTSFSMTDSGDFAIRSVSMAADIYYHTNSLRARWSDQENST